MWGFLLFGMVPGQRQHLPVFGLTNFCADQFKAVDALYSDHNHTYQAGAEIVARSIRRSPDAIDVGPADRIAILEVNP